MYNLFKNSSFSHLLEFFDNYKDIRILDLYKSFKQTKTSVSMQFYEIVKKHIAYTYGDDFAKRASSSLLQGDCLFAANHGGFENLPYVLASSLLIKATSSYLDLGDNVFFTCNSITPKNPSYPTSLKFGLRQNNRYNTINLIPRKYDQCFLDNIRAISADDIASKQDRINNLSSALDLQAVLKLQGKLIQFNKDDSFITQSSLLNTNVYDEYMPSALAKNYYISIEAVAQDCLLEDLTKEHSFINKLLKSEDKLLCILKALANHLACFDERLIDLKDELISFNNLYGTILFYAINEKKQKEQCKLIQKADGLYLKSYSLEIKLSPKYLYEALAEHRLVPNIYTINMSFMFDHKVKLVGGIFMSYYMKHMINVTRQYLGLTCDSSYYDKNLICACIMPFAAFNFDNKAYPSHPLVFLDLLKAYSLSSHDIEKVLHSTLYDVENYTLANIALDNFTQEHLAAYQHDLYMNLKQGSCINLIS